MASSGAKSDKSLSKWSTAAKARGGGCPEGGARSLSIWRLRGDGMPACRARTSLGARVQEVWRRVASVRRNGRDLVGVEAGVPEAHRFHHILSSDGGEVGEDLSRDPSHANHALLEGTTRHPARLISFRPVPQLPRASSPAPSLSSEQLVNVGRSPAVIRIK